MTTPAFSPEDIGELVEVSSPALSPDGRRIAYVLSRVDAAANRSRRSLWIAEQDGSRPPRRMSSGLADEGAAVWAPTGERLYATSTGRTGSTAAPHALIAGSPDGGEVVILAERDEGFEQLTVSPDGRFLAFVSRRRGPGYAAADTASRPPRKITGLRSRNDGLGWTIDRPRALYVIASDGGSAPREIAVSDAETHSPAWGPDSRTLAFVSARHPDADLDNVDDVWSVLLDDLGDQRSAPERLTTTDAVHMLPSYSPEGELAYYRSAGPAGRRLGHRHSRVVVRAVNGQTQTLAPELDLHLTPGSARPPLWSGDGVVVQAEERGSVPLLRLGRTGGVERLIDGPGTVTGYDIAGDTLVAAMTVLDRPTEIVTRSGSEPLRRLSEHQSAFLAAHPPLVPERFTVTSEDGCPVDAWLLLPDGGHAASPATLPLILCIHGGPQAQYGERWFDEFQVLASAGFAVLFANPHGSTGGDEHFARAILAPCAPEDPGTGWGELDKRDLLAVLDAALARVPALDADRVGVWGGSYGGYMTSWLVATEDRFRAACSERAVNNMLSEEWTSDLAGHMHLSTGADAQRHPEELVRMSPVGRSADIRTPLLILHAENDERCPLEQAFALYVPLRRRGHEVEFWVFPGEGHEMSRSGSPRHRIQRFDIVLDWFRRHLTTASPRSAGEGVTP